MSNVVVLLLVLHWFDFGGVGVDITGVGGSRDD